MFVIPTICYVIYLVKHITKSNTCIFFHFIFQRFAASLPGYTRNLLQVIKMFLTSSAVISRDTFHFGFLILDVFVMSHFDLISICRISPGNKYLKDPVDGFVKEITIMPNLMSIFSLIVNVHQLS